MTSQCLFRCMNAYDLHKTLINDYILNFKGATKLLARDTSKDRRDQDVIRDNHKFLWEDTEADTWERRLAKKYYDKLFKEYCICDLTRYKENKVALRWRTQQEVVVGKGQFICANKTCTERKCLRTWEVNFAYVENENKKNALVKVRLCLDCSVKLNYKSKKRELKRLKTIHKKSHKTNKSNAKNKTETDDKKETKAVEVDPRSKEDTTGEEINECWQKASEREDISRDEEFEEYLEALLL